MSSIGNLSVCTVHVHVCIRTHIPHIVYAFQYNVSKLVSVILQIVHVATMAAVQLALAMLPQTRQQRQRIQRFRICPGWRQVTLER